MRSQLLTLMAHILTNSLTRLVPDILAGMSKRKIMEYVEQYRTLVDEAIEAELEHRLQEVGEISEHLVPIVEAMRELSVGGKRLRAILTILGYELTQPTRPGPVGSEIVRAGAAMEIFHLGLLIQDDMMDRDELRRGVKAIHARYPDPHTGNWVAMLAGDYTFGWVTEILAGLEMPEGHKQAALSTWAKYFIRVGYGQTLDGLMVADEGSLMKILQLKSGEYSCVLPLLLGAELGGAKEKLKERLSKYGMEMGWVFQLRDDWLSQWGEEEKTGKPVGNDEREGKRTYASLYGRERLEAEIARHVAEGRRSILRGRTPKEGIEIMEGLLEWMATREN